MKMINIREIEDKDLNLLGEFLPTAFPFSTKELWLQLFEYWWDKNPAYNHSIPKGWLLEKDAGIIGFIGNIPVKFLVRGEITVGVASNSWYAAPSARGAYSLALFHKFINQKGVALFLFKSNDNTFSDFLSRYHFREFILPINQREYIYIIDKDKIRFNIFKFIFDDKIPRLDDFQILSRRTGALIASYFYQKPLLATPSPGNSYTSSVCISCDLALSELFRSKLNRSKIILSPDKETLEWLLFTPGRVYKRIVIQCKREQDNSLAGCMVFDVVKDKKWGTLQLMDLCIRDENPEVLTSMISLAIETGKQNNAAFLSVWSDNEEIDAYFNKVFFLRRSKINYRYAKFSELSGSNSMPDSLPDMGSSLIYPPQ
jgi:hypothetical protein